MEAVSSIQYLLGIKQNFNAVFKKIKCGDPTVLIKLNFYDNLFQQVGCVVYKNKTVEFCCQTVRCQVYEMWSQGIRVACGYVSEDTKV